MLSLFKRSRTALTASFPENFVDIHSHILPGIDDGAKTLEDSIKLIKKMHSYGISNFRATPHIMEDVWENTPEIIQQKLQEVKTAILKEQLTGITIKAAAEYMLDANFEKLLNEKKLLTLKDNYLLIEMSYLNPPVNLYDILFKIQVAGYQPILAHPERYNFLHSNFNEYHKLKNAGCLFQLNLLSLSNYYGKSVHHIAIQLLEQQLIDFVGTDTHHQRHLEQLEKINKKKVLRLVTPLLKNNSKLL
ncbi:Tyrosine-protein phosphatase YwqE [Lutibacter oricola]|uniref:protein-tyrosine-phosphatase n=1 Tax=Lutibacter oricola TaxID=762486 RepID=A0A1H3FQY5_9FLAO|nr:CpsB/CapC family capsule biosynthesis tyrosine phosphatase [Lutibacter oricola]SDX93426.1 Tyrosine-protein phosphatase YwqE [Lutibacter oricola]